MPYTSNPDVNRRSFIQNIGAGFLIGSAGPVMLTAASVAAEHLTDRPIGNAGIQVKASRSLADLPDIDLVEAGIETPIIEEALFRGIPAIVVDTTNSDERHETLRNLHAGKGRFDFSRRELISNAVTSAAFAAVHNVTTKGFDTTTLPIPQFVGGVALWITSRRYGLPASMTAHGTANLWLVSAIKIAKGTIK